MEFRTISEIKSQLKRDIAYKQKRIEFLGRRKGVTKYRKELEHLMFMKSYLTEGNS